MVLTDSVYKTVLNILNKENRGYVTPAEFNTLAKQAQNEIFEGYFSSRNYAITNSSDYSDIRKNIEEKILDHCATHSRYKKSCPACKQVIGVM